ncbi:MAG: tetratricopeptide repeat protein [Chitinispirillaceae bacterium]|nr:tetratricopeptide repeat protein [Chitinispirillaceae bacterium]
MKARILLQSAETKILVAFQKGHKFCDLHPIHPSLTWEGAERGGENACKAINTISVTCSVLPLGQFLSHIITLFILIVFNTNGTSYLEEGNQLYRDGNYEKAVTSFHKAISNNENAALSWFNLGNALYQTGKIQKSISCYESAVEYAPDFMKGWQNLGILYYELQDYGACISALEHILAHDSANSMVYSLLAASHKALEHYSSATLYLEKVLEKDSTFVDAILMLYDISRSTGDITEALSWLSRYPPDGSRYNDILLITGELKLEQGDTTGALALFRQFTRQSPGTMRGWIELVNILHGMNAHYAAVSEALEAVEHHQSFTELAQLGGRIAFEAGYYDKAEYFFSVLYKNRHPDGVVGLGNLYNIYTRQGEPNSISRTTALLNGGSNGKK